MQITEGQVAQEIQVNSSTALLQELQNTYGVRDPKIILAFAPSGAKDWKVHVFFNSPATLQRADLDVDTVLMNVKIKAKNDEVIKTIYPGGWIGWCGKINGQQVWIT